MILLAKFVRDNENRHMDFQISTMDLKGRVCNDFIGFTIDVDRYARLISCHGLVLFRGISSSDNFLCNPSTQEFVRMPMNESCFQTRLGLGYLASTNEYKLVSLIYWGEDDGVVDYYILTVPNGGASSASWSHKFCNFYWPWSSNAFFENPTCVDGVLYWFVWDSDYGGAILSFDLEMEELVALSCPCSCSDFVDVCLLEFGGFLCFAHLPPHTGVTDLWMLMDHANDTWEMKCSIDLFALEDYNDPDGFILIDCINDNGKPQHIRGWTGRGVTVHILPVAARDGEILLEVNYERFYFYNIEIKSFERVECLNTR